MKNKILTPHLGEFANLIGIKTEELKKALAAKRAATTKLAEVSGQIPAAVEKSEKK